MEYLTLEEAISTNSYLKEREDSLSVPLAVRAVRQTAGRGQRGNSWEAAPGENLTFSVLWQSKGIAPREQFAISEAVALGVCDYLAGRGIESMVKWPNDIYVGNYKICGILIEHSITGSRLDRSILGVGINVNQKEFLSDAPNPVSMGMITGMRYGLEEELRSVGTKIEEYLLRAETAEGRRRIHEEFLGSLWRGDGELYPFRDSGSGLEYRGRIRDVAPDGFLIIEDEEGKMLRYAFKEVEFILKQEEDDRKRR